MLAAVILEVSAWSAVPFVALLLAIALLPLTARHFWESNRNKALVAALASLPVIVYLFARNAATQGAALESLRHEIAQYVSFIILLGSLYTVAGGIGVRGGRSGGPGTNAGLLAVGAVLANLIGTTGAGTLLIRPLLHMNRRRQHTGHLVVFFIFMVCNLGGLLTPLGDPPLFLGFLNGVGFFWTLSLWPQWLFANGIVLTIFYCWDTFAYRREPEEARVAVPGEPLRVEGKRNIVFLVGIATAVLLQSRVPGPVSELLMLAMALASWRTTPPAIRAANGFGWAPIVEVAVLFAGIFITMVPALALLAKRGPALGLGEPWQYFWLTGLLSSFLDNAPTYAAFATLAAGSSDIGLLTNAAVAGAEGPRILQAISCGAVFMGANTYIANGPNFMVKAIAEHAGYPTPSFLGYMAYTAVVLLPVFGLVTLVFFL